VQQQHRQQGSLSRLRDAQFGTVFADYPKLAKKAEPHQSPQRNSRPD
jgi:hypothetical protein